MNTRFSTSIFKGTRRYRGSLRSTLHKLSIVTLTTTIIGLTGTVNANSDDLQLAETQSVESVLVPNYNQGDMYIVQLSDPAIATYDGGIPGYAATSAKANGLRSLDTTSSAAKNYEKRLQTMQAEMVDKAASQMGRTLKPKFTYQHAINGFAAKMSQAEAKMLRKMDGVKSVQRERIEYTVTERGPEWIGAPKLWNNGRRSSFGEGLVIAVLDSGINSDHPSFADVGGDGYDHENPLGSGNYVPGSYCDTVDPGFCNDKLIGAWDFTDIDGTVPEDDDGHGSHTASTAAGNFVVGATLTAPTTSQSFDISGVAPHANIIAYDVCQRTCPGAALIAAINQVVIDAGNLPNGIAALNYSISGGGDPYNDPVELGFLAAVEAGIYVSASAGNSGPTAGTVAHLGPWVSTTAASTHDRRIVNSLNGISSDTSNTPDISGVGFTSAYGPAKIVNSADFEADYPGSTLCATGEAGSNTSPWPADFFNGEIVACTRGEFGRVEKGINVLASGAGGYVLMDNGAGVVSDAHVLPGVHISQEDSTTLADWLAANVDNNPVASIAGSSLDISDENGDIMAGFSSRGPSQTLSVLKPDVTAPGVSIMAAEANNDSPPEYQFLSGTSMSSPHNAGAGALLSAARPDWTPTEIKSAIMLTATTKNTRKEDGVTPTDPFDLGAGRIALKKADRSGLIMSETIANFEAANPELGGDPKTLNLASVMDNNCVGTCSWKRTVTNTLNRTGYWNVIASGDGFEADVSVSPRSYSRRHNLRLRPGQSAEITITAQNYTSDVGWQFGEIELQSKSRRPHRYNRWWSFGFLYRYHHYYHASRKSGPDLHMPMAVRASKGTNVDVFSKTVDATTASRGDVLTYELSVRNGQIGGPITVSDVIPRGTRFVRGSETEDVALGTTTSAFSYDRATRTVSWTGELDQSSLDISAIPAPFGYFSLGAFGIAPLTSDCNGDCDDGGFFFDGVPAFTFNGESYNQVLFSVNGTLEAGSASGVFSSAANQDLPDDAAPNNVMAPFWRDLDLSAGGNMYQATLSLPSGEEWTVYEWADVPHFSNTPGPDVPAVTMQIWIGSDGTPVAGDIHYVYARLDDTNAGGTVGAENTTGTVGTSYFFDGAGTAPVVGTDLLLSSVAGGSATLGFQVTAKCRGHHNRSRGGQKLIINKASLSSGSSNEEAIAVTACE